MRSGWRTPRDSVLSSPTSAPILLEWPLTASAPMSDVSAPVYTCGCGPFSVLWVWRRRTNRWPCCPPMSNPSTSSGLQCLMSQDDETTEWLAVQHLPRDPAQPNSGYSNWLKRWRKSILILQCMHKHWAKQFTRMDNITESTLHDYWSVSRRF